MGFGILGKRLKKMTVKVKLFPARGIKSYSSSTLYMSPVI